MLGYMWLASNALRSEVAKSWSPADARAQLAADVGLDVEKLRAGEGGCRAVAHGLLPSVAAANRTISAARRGFARDMKDLLARGRSANRVQTESIESPADGRAHGMETSYRHVLRASRAHRNAWDATRAAALLHNGCFKHCTISCLEAVRAEAEAGRSDRELSINVLQRSFDGSHSLINQWVDFNGGWLEGYFSDLQRSIKFLGRWIGDVEETRHVTDEGQEAFYYTCGVGSFSPLCHLRHAQLSHFYGWSSGTRMDFTADTQLLFHVATKVFSQGDVIADVGAGPGHYGEWLNSTGKVLAHSFDGTPMIDHLTNSRVRYVNFGEPVPNSLRGAFDWVLSLEMIEHIPRELEQRVVANIAAMARKGAVVSWSEDVFWKHANPRDTDYAIAAFDKVGLHEDSAATRELRAACRIDYISRGVAVYRKPKMPNALE